MKPEARNDLRVLLIVVLAFALFLYAKEYWFLPIRTGLRSLLPLPLLTHFLTYIIIGIPLFVAVWWIHQFKIRWVDFGFSRCIDQPLLFALICTLPMFVGYGLVFGWNAEVSWTGIFGGVICAAFFEELYYRAILFGQLFRNTRLGFVPAILIGAVLFGLSHLYQSEDPSTMLGVFMTTFMGAVLFAWVYVEWNFNLWVPILLHAFMNLSWMLFSAGDTALGGLYSNLFRGITIALIIILTIRYKRKQKLQMLINRKTLLWETKNS